MDPYERMNDALDRRLRPWIGMAVALINGRVADARAHADKAITDTLKATPDGRPSALRVQRSPSYQAALNRLDELQAALIGPNANSLSGLVRDARASFYVGSVELWKGVIPPEHRSVKDPVPTAKGEAIVRGALIHDTDLSREVGPSFQRSKDRLFAAINGAGRIRASERIGVALLDRWERETRDRLIGVAMTALSDGDKAIHETTGRAMLRKELLPKELRA